MRSLSSARRRPPANRRGVPLPRKAYIVRSRYTYTYTCPLLPLPLPCPFHRSSQVTRGNLSRPPWSQPAWLQVIAGPPTTGGGPRPCSSLSPPCTGAVRPHKA